MYPEIVCSEFSKVARAKAARATTRRECDAAIVDCHETLVAGNYDHASAYALKLWCEIDAYRDRLMVLIGTDPLRTEVSA